jgi:succinate dehydrogenase / fumarate reductase flavoprotein subunit
VLKLVHDGDGRIAGCVAYWRPTGEFVTFSAKAVILATGGAGKSWKFTSNSGEVTGDGHAMALWAGAQLIDMECIQFHPTGMVWPLSVRGLLVTEGVRGDGGVLRNSEGQRFMFNYVAPMFRDETAETEEEGDKWYDDHAAGRRPPELLPRDEVARAINAEVKAGRGSPHGGVYLDIASRRTPPPPWCPASSPPAKLRAECTEPTDSAETRSATSWSLADVPAWGRRTTSSRARRRRQWTCRRSRPQ